jgi:hypothetical protein
VPIDGRAADPVDEVERVDLTVVPALFEHAVRVYKEMEKNSEVDSDFGDNIVYEGHLTNLFKRLRLSVPYYTSIKNQLVGMGCIEQVRRGGGNATSKWVLWKVPELEEWKNFGPARARRGNATQMMAGQIKTLHERVTKLEDIVVNMTIALEGMK